MSAYLQKELEKDVGLDMCEETNRNVATFTKSIQKCYSENSYLKRQKKVTHVGKIIKVNLICTETK